MIETLEIKGSKMIEAVVVMVGWGDDVDTQYLKNNGEEHKEEREN